MFRKLWYLMGLCLVALLMPTGTAQASNATTDLMWFNSTTGELSSWQLNGYGNVLGTQSLSWRCDAASTCSWDWSPISSGDVNNDGDQDLLWYNTTSGELSAWLLNSSGTVLGTQAFDWRCDIASTCAYQWRPVGLGDMNRDGKQDLLWWNDRTGELSSWILNGYGNVLWAQSVDWRCDRASGCADEWTPFSTGDFNSDGNQDITWWNSVTGEISSWLLNSGGVVVAKQSLNATCLFSRNCLPMGLGDLNGDGTQDVMRLDYGAGEVSTWLTNGHGSVIGTQTLDWRCDWASGCAYQWRPVAIMH